MSAYGEDPSRGARCLDRILDTLYRHFSPQNRASTIVNLICIISWAIALFSIVLSGGIVGVVNAVREDTEAVCESTCRATILETIPTGIQLSQEGLSSNTTESLLQLINDSSDTLTFLEFYFNLNNSVISEAHGEYGRQVFDAILAARRRGVDVDILYNKPYSSPELGPSFISDSAAFSRAGINIRSFNVRNRWGQNGMLRTHVLISDSSSFYIGSSPMSWTSFSQTKEFGILFRECECLATDLQRIVNVVSTLRDSGIVDESFDTNMFLGHPANVNVEVKDKDKERGNKGSAYFCQSPSSLASLHRTSELEALVDLIASAPSKSVLRIAVPSFVPVMLYGSRRMEIFSELSVALQNAVTSRGVRVKLLVSRSNNETAQFQPWREPFEGSQREFLRSLSVFSKICSSLNETETGDCVGSLEIREFVIPSDPALGDVIYNNTRISGSSFVVAESKVWVGGSGWVMDWFENSIGVSMVLSHEEVRLRMKEIFDRDWSSNYSLEL